MLNYISIGFSALCIAHAIKYGGRITHSLEDFAAAVVWFALASAVSLATALALKASAEGEGDAPRAETNAEDVRSGSPVGAYSHADAHIAERAELWSRMDTGDLVFLVRHAYSQSNKHYANVNAGAVHAAASIADDGSAAAAAFKVLDTPLDELGREQAAITADFLAGVVGELRKTRAVDVAVLTSPLSRARATAEPLAARLGVAAEVVQVVEPVDAAKYGEAQVASAGVHPHADFADYWQRVVEAAPDMFLGVFDRMRAARPECGTRIIFVVTHALFKSYLLQHLAGAPRPAAGQAYHPMFHNPNNSITGLGVHNRTFGVLHAASTAHLAAHHVTGSHGLS